MDNIFEAINLKKGQDQILVETAGNKIILLDEDTNTLLVLEVWADDNGTIHFERK